MTSFLRSDRSRPVALWLFCVAILVFAMVVVGGLDNPVGSLLGAVFITAVQYWLQDRPELAQTLFGAAIVVALLWLPRGLVGIPNQGHAILRSLLGRLEHRSVGA